MSLVELKRDDAGEIRAELDRAAAEADNCDSVLILMEEKGGGVRWFANSTVKLATMNWLLDSMKHHLFTDLAAKER